MRQTSIFLIALGFMVNSLSAYGLRCENHLVDIGDSSSRLTQYCGQPLQVERFNARVPIRTYDRFRDEYIVEYVNEPYEIWTYNFGSQRFLMHITIRKGVVTEIESDGYGY